MSEELSLLQLSASAPAVSMRDVLVVVFRQRRLLLISFAATFLLVLVYGLLTPSYQAQMKVLVRRGRIDPVVTSTPTQPPLFPRDEITEEELNSEVELLRDQQILHQVVKTSELATEPGLWFWESARDNEEVQVARAVRRMASRLKVVPVRKTALIAVTYASSDPTQAAQVLNTLAGAYMERHLLVRRPSGEFSFFEQQVMQSRHGLEEAASRLIQFTRDQNVVSAGLERDISLQKLSEADANNQQTHVAISETIKRIRALEWTLKGLPERTTTQLRSSDNPQLLEKMKSKLLELELKRTELLTKFEPSFRLVQEVDQQIAETKSSLAAEDRAPVREETTEQDPNHEWAKAELVKSQVELSALEARATALSKVLSDYRYSAHRLGDDAVQQEQLARNLKAAEEKYLLYVNKREEARIADALDQGGILNVTIAEQPRVPALRARSEWSFGLLGILLAGPISLGLVFAADYLDPAFRTPEEVFAYLETPVLASLPSKNG
jgi:uncharacterized protein involved in exopolysaccharide biosynthesis